MNYLANAFSIQMLPAMGAIINAKPITKSEVPADVVSAIGHLPTAFAVGSILDREVECNRMSITLQQGDTLYVAQYTGPRLPEGAITLPVGAKITFWKVDIQ